MRYVFIGGKQTDLTLVNMECDPVRRADGKCVLNTKMAVALVVNKNGKRYVVPRRRLRLKEKMKKVQS